MSTIRGIRGATVVPSDHPEVILRATAELLHAIVAANPGLQPEDLASIFFTVTNDLCSEYPAKAARQMGWKQTPLMCAQEIPVPGSLPRCIRVLLHWNTDHSQNEIVHIYLGEAGRLRPDLVNKSKMEVQEC